jgi:uncharacterized membrane protein
MINYKAVILVILLILLLIIMFGRWETITEIGESSYLVKRDKLTSVTREYLPDTYRYQSNQDRYLVSFATFVLIGVIVLTVNELFKEMRWARTPAKEPEIDLITGSPWYDWIKVIVLIAIVILIVLFINILKVIPALQ